MHLIGQCLSACILICVLVFTMRLFRGLLVDMAGPLPPDYNQLLDGDPLVDLGDDPNIDILLDEGDDVEVAPEDAAAQGGGGGVQELPLPPDAGAVPADPLPPDAGATPADPSPPDAGSRPADRQELLPVVQIVPPTGLNGPDEAIINVSGSSTPVSTGGAGTFTPAALSADIEREKNTQHDPDNAAPEEPAVGQSQAGGQVDALLAGIRQLIINDRELDRPRAVSALESIAEEFGNANRGRIDRPLRCLFSFLRCSEVIWPLLMANQRAFSAFLCLMDREMSEEPLSFVRNGPDGRPACCAKLKASLEKEFAARSADTPSRKDQGRKRNHDNTRRDQSQQRGRNSTRGNHRNGGRSRSRSRSPRGRRGNGGRSRSRSRDRERSTNMIQPEYTRPGGGAVPVQTFIGQQPHQSEAGYVVSYTQPMLMPPPQPPAAQYSQMAGTSGTSAPPGTYAPGQEPSIQQRLQAIATEPRVPQPQGMVPWHHLQPLGPGNQVQLRPVGLQQPQQQQPAPHHGQPLQPQQRPPAPHHGQHHQLQQPPVPQHGQPQHHAAPGPVIPQGPGHSAPPPPPMTRTGSSSSTGSGAGTPREPTPEEAKQSEIRKREERAAARSLRQQPPVGATTSSRMSASQKSILNEFIRSSEFKALAPSVEEVDLASDEESGERDEDYVPDSNKKKRR